MNSIANGAVNVPALIERFDVTWSSVKRQTAKMASEFVFFSSNPSLNHIKIEKCLLLFATNTNISTILFKELKTVGKSFIFACRLPFDVMSRRPAEINVCIRLSLNQNTSIAHACEFKYLVDVTYVNRKIYILLFMTKLCSATSFKSTPHYFSLNFTYVED